MTTSAISKLDNDTLLSIFDTITSQIPERPTCRHTRPLTVVRTASQVCHGWRALLLASPCIWGRLVDLDFEAKYHIAQSVKWLQEVIRRAGESSPLWIYGHVRGSPNDYGEGLDPLKIDSYFIQLLESWDRIERLSVSIKLGNKKTLSRIQDRFLCRAPILKVFDVHFSSTEDLYTLQPGSSKFLFADHAPLLHTVNAKQVCYKLDSPWLSGIREIAPLPQHLTLQDTFILFQHTPMIERVGIYEENLSDHQSESPFPRLVLPNLSSITFRGDLSAFSAFIDHVSPGELTSLSIKVWDYQKTDLDGSPIPFSLKANLASYIHSYFTTNTSRDVELLMRNRSIRLVDASKVTRVDGLPDFEVMVEAYKLSHQDDWDNIVTSLLVAFTEGLGNLSTLRSVTELRLCLLEVQPTVIPELHATLALFRHVQHIHSNGHTLCHLERESGDDPQRFLFPELHTLHLTALTSQTICADLIQFLMTRKSKGFPVARLDLTRCVSIPKYADALCDLEAIHGLEVVWQKWGPEPYWDDGRDIRRHACGAGDREGLRNLLLS